MILKELLQYDPDVITLQECDHYYDFFLPNLSQYGYSGYFAPKPTSACLEVSNQSDGCALFIKKSKLSVVSIETKTLALSIAELGDGGEVKEDDKNIKAQNQVAIIALCKYIGTDSTTSPPPPIIIATTHLKSSKTATGERHRQKGISQILKQINYIYDTFKSYNMTPAVIVTGVLNAVTEYSNGYAPLTLKEVFDNPLGLRSIYDEDVPLSLRVLNNSKFYTQWKAKVKDGIPITDSNINTFNNTKLERISKRAIDYIFYTNYMKGDKLVQHKGVIAYSTNQIGLAFLMRSAVYFCGFIIPMTSLLSTTITNLEKVLLFVIVGFCTFVFEATSEGSIFKPQVNPNLLPKEFETELEHPIDSSLDTVDKNIPASDFGRATAVVTNGPSKVFKTVGSLLKSQSILPIKKYGRPGFQAVSALDVFSDEEVGENFNPSATYPSDHISIVADLHLLW
eukprot:gene21865-28304_t